MKQTDLSDAQDRSRLAVLISGRGSNLVAIHHAIAYGELPGAEIALVLANRPESAGLAWAGEQGLPTALVPRFGRVDGVEKLRPLTDYDAEILAALRAHRVDWVVLAGYDRILSDALLAAYAGRIVNIHPSLLPAHGGKGMLGMKVHRAVLAGGDIESGCTVHLVTADVDGGPVVAQRSVPVFADDTPDTLAARVLKEEHILYPLALKTLLSQKAPLLS